MRRRFALCLAVCLAAISAAAGVGVGSAVAAVPAPRTAPRLLGAAHVVGHPVTVADDVVEATELTAATSGTVASVDVFVRRADHRARLNVGIYTDHGDGPGRLLSDGRLLSLRAGAWNAVTISAAKIERGSAYWVATLARRGTVSLSGSSACVRSAGSMAGRFRARWDVAPPSRGCSLAVYATTTAPRATDGPPTTPTRTAPSATEPSPATPVTTIASPTATAAPTNPVAPAPVRPPSRTTDCFSSPGACGYPDPAEGDVGVADCSALAPFTLSDLPSADYYHSGSGDTIEIDANNVLIQGYDISGYAFELSGVSGTTFNDDCVTDDGDSGADNAIYVTSNGFTLGSHTTVTNSTVTAQGCPVATAASAECTSTGVVQQLASGGVDSTYDDDIFAGAVEDVGMLSGSTLENSYVVANGYANGAHTEDTYSSPGSSDMTIRHNTLLNPSDETAEVFIDNGTGPCTSTANTIDDNLMAGGGYVVYACSGATGSYPLTFTGNDIARCTTQPPTHDYPGLGGTTCGALPPSSTTHDTGLGAGGDDHGYWPDGGYFGLDANVFCSGAGVTWSGNVSDDDGAPIACES